MENKIIVIGICGQSCSGKIYLSHLIKNHYEGLVTLLSFDMYCKDQSHLPFDERTKVNYDVPDAYDGIRLSEDLLSLKQNKETPTPIYDLPNMW